MKTLAVVGQGVFLTEFSFSNKTQRINASMDGSATQTDSSVDSVVEDEKTNSKLSGDSLDLQAEAATIVASDPAEMTDSESANVSSSVDGSATQAATSSDSIIGEIAIQA